MSTIEEKVLGSDLFLREARIYATTLNEDKKADFYKVMSQTFKDGIALEIIDGDIDSIETSTLSNVINWV